MITACTYEVFVGLIVGIICQVTFFRMLIGIKIYKLALKLKVWNELLEIYQKSYRQGGGEGRCTKENFH